MLVVIQENIHKISMKKKISMNKYTVHNNFDNWTKNILHTTIDMDKNIDQFIFDM